MCERAKIKLRYLGFDRTASYAGREFQFNLAKHEVFQLGFIQPPSYVLKDDFCVLANVQSIAYRETTKFREFDIIYASTGGGPSKATETLGIRAYNEAFGYFYMGRASVIGVLMLMIALAAVFIARRQLRKEFF